MATDFLDQQITHDDEPERQTRWDSRPTPLPHPEHDKEERGGIYLAAIIALVLPLLIAAVVLLPGSSTSVEVEQGEPATTTGLDNIAVTPSPSVDESGVTAEVAGTTLTNDAPSTSDVAPAPTPASDAADSPDAAAVTPTTADPPASVAPATAPSTSATPTTVDPSTTSPTTSTTPTTAAPSTTITTTTIVATSIVPLPTAPPLPTIVPTTITPPDIDPEPVPDPTAFEERVEIGQIGDTFVRFGFTAATTTSYSSVVRDADGRIVATSTGTAVGGERVTKSVNGLVPGIDHTLRVRLLGPPEAFSNRVPFRTSGGDPTPATELVEIRDLRVRRTDVDHVVVDYETNICANGSFVIRLEGEIVGRNGGQAEGCTTQHLAVPGIWTPPLEPDTTYVLTVTVEADGLGLGDGNTATQSITITTDED